MSLYPQFLAKSSIEIYASFLNFSGMFGWAYTNNKAEKYLLQKIAVLSPETDIKMLVK